MGKIGIKMRTMLFLVLSTVICGTVVHSQNPTPKNSRDSDISYNKLSFHRFSLSNSGINGIFNGFPLPVSEDSQLKQFSHYNSFLIKEEHDYVKGLERGDRAESTIIWAGILPFVSLPIKEVENREGFFSNGSVSFFWYLKKKF